MNTMWMRRNNVVFELIMERIVRTHIGLVVMGLDGIDPYLLAEGLSNRITDRTLHIGAVGYPETEHPSPDHVRASTIEEIVVWRNTPECAGAIVAFVLSEAPKLHSLAELDHISIRDVAQKLLEMALENLSENEPQERFWSALGEATDVIPLPLLEEFVQEVASSQNKLTSIPDNLWRLGLLCDKDILSATRNPVERLRQNRDLLLEIEQLSQSGRRRIANVIARASSKQKAKLRSTMNDIKRFHISGDRRILADISMDDAATLLQAGRKLPRASEEAEGSGDGETITRSKRVLKDKDLATVIAQLALDGDEDSRNDLERLVSEINERLEDEQDVSGIIRVDGWRENTIAQLRMPQIGLRRLVGLLCTTDCWGGMVRTSEPSIPQAVERCSPADVTRYKPDQTRTETEGESLFGILRELDAYVKGSDTFANTIQSLTDTRKKLLRDIDTIMINPLLALGSSATTFSNVEEYLNHYSKLLELFRTVAPDYGREDPHGLRYVAEELLQLDVVYFRCQTQNDLEVRWQAMLSPLHPISLWAYAEVMRSVAGDSSRYSPHELHQLSRAVADSPHLLQTVFVRSDVEGLQERFLPLTGSIGFLATYGHKASPEDGSEGTTFVGQLLKRWVLLTPYARWQIRLAIIDPPDIGGLLSEITGFLGDHPDSQVITSVYYTGSRAYGNEMTTLDYGDRDHQVGEMLLNGRLLLSCKSLDSLADSVKEIEDSPVHIAIAFDQSISDTEPISISNLTVSPLVVTYDYRYSKALRTGWITPACSAEQGLLHDYDFMQARVGGWQSPMRIRTTSSRTNYLKSLDDLSSTGSARWLAVAEARVPGYVPEKAILLSENRLGQRDVMVWACSHKDYVDSVANLLRRFNLKPTDTHVSRLLRKYGHIGSGGIERLLTQGMTSNRQLRHSAQKGLLGSIIACAWYRSTFPNSLVASLDSDQARLWLSDRPSGDERADIIGLRVDNGGSLYVDVIEVKAYANAIMAPSRDDRHNGTPSGSGSHAFDQVRAVIEVIKAIFGEDDEQPLMTPARREILKYQLYRECFREIHEHQYRAEWFDALDRAFGHGGPRMPVEIRGLVVHVLFEEDGPMSHKRYCDGLVKAVTLRTGSIQQIVGHSQVSEEETDQYTHDGHEVRIYKAPGVPSGDSHEPSNKDEVEFSIVVSGNKEDSCDEASDSISNEDRERIVKSFTRAAASFNIRIAKCESERVIVGPNVIRLYVKLARGQREDAFRNALHDIGREMSRTGLIVTRIKNSDELALDIPRLNRQPVNLISAVEVVETPESADKLPILIGVTPEGEHIVAELDAMPHLMVGGTTGSGKTMFLYGVLISLLRTHPDPSTLRLFISTSKPTDFVFFNRLQNLETGSVISDAREAVEWLNAVSNEEFARRENILFNARCRDVRSYNQKHKDVQIPPLVVVVDEFADLSDQFGSNRSERDEFYRNIRRIAQLGRNKGMHLILCTQRPSADLVPTDIRTLMNGRVALRVNDATASRMILEEMGAEDLQMHGDLLFKYDSTVRRAQGYFVNLEDEPLDSFLR